MSEKTQINFNYHQLNHFSTSLNIYEKITQSIAQKTYFDF